MSTPAAPFYYVQRSPPPPLPLPLMQTELHVCLPTILSQEQIDLKQHNAPLANPRPRIVPVRATLRPRVAFVKCTPSPAAEVLASEPNEGAPSEDYTEPEGGEESALIKKPKGTFGRPHSGGYSLDCEVMKHNVDYEALKNYVTTLVSKSLNKNLSYKKQPKAMIIHIIDETILQFPKMNRFSRNWPITDIIQAFLKASTAKAKQDAAKKEASKDKMQGAPEIGEEQGEVGPVRNVGPSRMISRTRPSPVTAGL